MNTIKSLTKFAAKSSKPSAVRLQVEKFVEACILHGFSWSVRENVVMITKTFAPGDSKAFVQADIDAPHVLSLAPLRGGSIWGTDGGSVGGYVGCKNGMFTMNKSGNGSRFLNELRNFA